MTVAGWQEVPHREIVGTTNNRQLRIDIDAAHGIADITHGVADIANRTAARINNVEQNIGDVANAADQLAHLTNEIAQSVEQLTGRIGDPEQGFRPQLAGSACIRRHEQVGAQSRWLEAKGGGGCGLRTDREIVAGVGERHVTRAGVKHIATLGHRVDRLRIHHWRRLAAGVRPAGTATHKQSRQ